MFHGDIRYRTKIFCILIDVPSIMPNITETTQEVERQNVTGKTVLSNCFSSSIVTGFPYCLSIVNLL